MWRRHCFFCVAAVAYVSVFAFANKNTTEQNATEEPAGDVPLESQEPDANFSSIVARFHQMQAAIDALTSQMDIVQNQLTQVESFTASTNASVSQAETMLIDLTATAVINGMAVDRLTAAASNATAQVQVASEELTTLVDVVQSMDSTSQQLGAASADVDRKLTQLETLTNEILPGYSTLTDRINNVTGTISAYQGEVDRTHEFENMVAARLRTSFRKSTQTIADLAETVENGSLPVF